AGEVPPMAAAGPDCRPGDAEPDRREPGDVAVVRHRPLPGAEPPAPRPSTRTGRKGITHPAGRRNQDGGRGRLDPPPPRPAGGVGGWVYYCVDDFSKWPGLDQDTLRQMEADLVPRVDVTIAVSETIRDHLRTLGAPPPRLLTHGIDPGHWTAGGPLPTMLSGL